MLLNKPKVLVTVVSDVHIDIKSETASLQKNIFELSLKSARDAKSDAFISVGDTTSRGEKTNWNSVRECFSSVPRCAERILLAVGNHDCWSDGEDEYACGIGEYYSAVRDITGKVLTKPYFAEYINGCSFIFLGNESDMGCDADISDTQLYWLRNELEKGTVGNKPVFVFSHQSLNGRHGLPRTWDKNDTVKRPPEEGGIGAKSEEIAELLKKYKNIFYFSGHSHMGLCGENMQDKEGYASFQCEDGLHLINLPCLTKENHHGEINTPGIGLRLEVYENTVKILPLNFISGEFETTVSIKGGKPYYEVEIIK